MKARNTARTAGELLRLFEEVRPVWVQWRFQDITRRGVVELLDASVDRGAPIPANRTLASAARGRRGTGRIG